MEQSPRLRGVDAAKTPETAAVCAYCKHWELSKSQNGQATDGDEPVNGICHRFPPVGQLLVIPVMNTIKRTMEPTVQPMTAIPFVPSNYFCGEFKGADPLVKFFPALR
jgi:hypothetical protein